MKKKLYLVWLLVLCGCAQMKMTTPFPIDENGPVEKVSSSDICRAQKMLSSATSRTPIDAKSQDMLVFDGVLIEAKSVSRSNQEVTFKVGTVLFSNESHLPNHLSVLTPNEKDGGITIAIGEQYRVSAVPLNNKYYTWAASGTAPKDSSFSGLYGCRK